MHFLFRFKVWEELGRDIFPPTLKFLKNECCSALMTDVGSVSDEVNTGIQEISSFLKILSVLLDKMFLRDDFEKKQKSMEQDGMEIVTILSFYLL